MTNAVKIAFIGFGEAGQAIAAGLRETGAVDLTAWDILFPESQGAKLREAARRIGARCAASAADAVRGREIVISAVTAASSLEAAQSVAGHLQGQLYLDINSVSPDRKRRTARLIEATGRYADVAVMAPVYPARHQTPMLIAGPHAGVLAPIMDTLGMKAAVAGPQVGAAAAIKMVRSVMVKGLEALTYECFVAAARAGVEKEVMASLAKSFPGLEWPKMVEYNLERMATHGARRAAEMEEVADTVRELGIEPLMAAATVARQREMSVIGKAPEVRAAIERDDGSILRTVSEAGKAPRN
ncbi:MAG TPA: DUF1932 domain-containing protein [Pseudorhodoplanes sp.]|nr:DUF1932 domain-containing protein [Pseudorhodoplanes sp.]